MPPLARRRAVLAAALSVPALLPREAVAQTRWVAASPYPDGSFHTRNLRTFIEDVERATGGRLSIQLHNNATLLPLPQIKRGVQQGQVQLGEILLSAYGNEDPFFEVDSVPFLADTWEAAAALDAATQPYIRARLERQGLALLYMVNWPSQGFYTRGEIRSVEDLRGARFRTYNNLTLRMAELMGAQPTTVQVAEVAQAFATNVINAMITSAQTGVDTSAWDYARVFTDVGGMRARNAILVNLRALNSLDEATRSAVREAAARAAARGLELAKASETEMVERLRAQGMQIARPSPQLMAQLREIGARQTQEWLQRAGPDGQQMLERFRAALRG
ncbi:MAG TPA: TRAP transporter substrate-binding protein [Acetobacteraceae bacterium]|nr:TRAP transporter substrate-binding protein [Acetobacteraceae bacterium]